MPSGYEKWKLTVDKSKSDSAWSAYDNYIVNAVREYNSYLGSTPGFTPLDWRLIKAMIWTESGPYAAEWKTRPMQIGNYGDPGLAALLSGKEGGELILPPLVRASLTIETVRTVPQQNIRAGIGYLLMRLAHFAFKSTDDPTDTATHLYTVAPGDSLAKIALKVGATVSVLQDMNPKLATLQPKQVLQFRKASVKKMIIGWSAITTNTIAQKYNSNLGDSQYAEKLDYCLSVMGGR